MVDAARRTEGVHQRGASDWGGDAVHWKGKENSTTGEEGKVLWRKLCNEKETMGGRTWRDRGGKIPRTVGLQKNKRRDGGPRDKRKEPGKRSGTKVWNSMKSK